jgi:hypothetical protein
MALETRKEGFFETLRERELAEGAALSLGVTLGLTLATYLFSSVAITEDRMIPFRSVGFVLGSGAIFYLAVTYSTKIALYLAAGVLALMGVVQVSYGMPDGMPAAAVAVPVEVPLVAVFFVGLAILPNVVPWIYEAQADDLAEKNARLEARAAELRAQLDKVEKEEIKEKSTLDRKEQVKYSSRATALTTFAREILQAGSHREVLNLLFHNVTKMMGVEECLMLVINREAGEAVVSRALHPEHETLENSRVPLANPLIAEVLEGGKPLTSVSPRTLVEGVNAIHVFPITFDGQIVTVFVIGKFKGGEPGGEDYPFIEVLARIAEGALEQLRIAMSTA